MDTSKKAKIYALICPLNNKVVYIGKTINPLSIRLSQHLNKNIGNKRKRDWVDTLKIDGLKPRIVLLESISNDSHWNKQEIKWISKIGLNNLLNDNKGGGGGRGQTTSVYLKRFKDFLFEGYSKNSLKNYYSIVSTFLRLFCSDRPRNITSIKIKRYVDSFNNNSKRNNVISGLKLFYKNIVGQPNKLNSIKYRYK